MLKSKLLTFLKYHYQLRNASTKPFVVIPSNIISSSENESQIKHISASMKAYLEAAQQHDALLKSEREEFNLGKRHLANIMGLNPEQITQNDINRSIKYLLPSGLFEEKARPVMYPPEDIFPIQKILRFDYTGRPTHFLYYTGKANFFQTLHDIASSLKELDKYEDEMIKNGHKKPVGAKFNTVGSEWLTREGFERLFMEKLNDYNWNDLTYALDRLIDHPYSSRCNDFIMRFRIKLEAQSSRLEFDPLTYTEDGRFYSKGQGLRKKCVANVTVWGNGTGQVNINGHDILYFLNIIEREQIMFPLKFTGLLNKVDFEATVEGYGTQAQAGAIRHALSLALRPFVDSDTLEKMRLAGLLTKDRRVKERHKPGRLKARKMPRFRPR